MQVLAKELFDDTPCRRWVVAVTIDKFQIIITHYPSRRDANLCLVRTRSSSSSRMMRVPSTPDEPLVRLFRHRQWPEVLERLEANPSEAAPTEGALRGEKVTMLALALRIGAPLMVIQALVQADRRQLLVCHRFAGSVIHEALRYLSPQEIFSFLFREALEEQLSSTQRARRDPSTKLSPVSPAQFQCVHVQENRVVQAPILLQVQDDLGRTVLHHVVEQIQRRRSLLSRQTGSTCAIFKQIIQACPDLVHTTDSDGNTALVLLLSQHPDTPDPELEQEICEMVEYLTNNYPSTVAHARRMTRSWRFMNHFPLQYTTPANRLPVASPLYFAILYGRCEATIRALLQAHERIGDPGCATIVTQYCEFCLHVAVTLRAPVGVLQLLVNAYPEAVHGADIYGLTPLDWLWMTFVVDWQNQGDQIHRRLSRRRHLGREFRDWHELVTDRIPYEPDRYDFLDETTAKGKQQDFLSRLRVMLSVPDNKGLLPWVCRSNNLPIGILKLVLELDKWAPLDLTQPDAIGRIPLHNVASVARGYRVSLPLGVTSRVQQLVETKNALAVSELVERYPEGCRVRDANGQLPLHVAIDASKRDRNSGESGVDDAYSNALLEQLLDTFPEGLGEPDGKTELYPWQQAAVGHGAQLNTIFQLLRKEPVFLELRG